MAICPPINLSEPAKFKREHGIYLVLSTPKCTHSPENQHTGNNPEVMGGISTVGSGLWDGIEGLAISGRMSKGSGIKELVLVSPPTSGGRNLGRRDGVRETQLVWVQQGAPVPLAALKSLTVLKEKKKMLLTLLFCFGSQLPLEIDFQLGTSGSRSCDS